MRRDGCINRDALWREMLARESHCHDLEDKEMTQVDKLRQSRQEQLNHQTVENQFLTKEHPDPCLMSL